MILLLYSFPVTVTALLDLLDIRVGATDWLGVTSPFAAIFALPLDENLNRSGEVAVNVGNLPLVAGYFATSLLMVAAMIAATVLRLRNRGSLVE
jgi:hypothetical protein